ncbi:hypothetical protein PZH37_17470, partial [[Eubacterium] siraeum]|nr:hypothetical protein [[Eubacterium] siraeum]
HNNNVLADSSFISACVMRLTATQKADRVPPGSIAVYIGQLIKYFVFRTLGCCRIVRPVYQYADVLFKCFRARLTAYADFLRIGVF